MDPFTAEGLIDRLDHIAGSLGTLVEVLGRPSAVFKLELSLDGDQYCALYGADLQSGCAGFGATPALAMEDFDNQWRTSRLAPAAQS